MYRAPDQCPTCHSSLTIRELGCQVCGTSLRGNWAGNPFSKLNDEQQAFLSLFVRSRGNLSEVERALGVSYPTVRAKLEEIIDVLEPEDPAAAEPEPSRGRAPDRQDVLGRVASGELRVQDALEQLRRLRGSERG
jgi:hypothetical protein